MTATSLASLALACCASLDSPYGALPAATELARIDATGECLRRLQSFDAAIDAAALRDVQAMRVAGYPHLRADRFAVRPGTGGQAVVQDARARVERMVALDAEARGLEMKNLGLAPAEREKVRLLDENLLRALPRASDGEASRSAYGPDAMIAGSERAERWFYWPMGIPSAGQMRHWGHHATAFVGRRHFDDPLLIDRYFILFPRDGSG